MVLILFNIGLNLKFHFLAVGLKKVMVTTYQDITNLMVSFTIEKRNYKKRHFK